MLTVSQKNALRYYIGVPDAYPGAPADPTVYNTVNCLFFEGIGSETDRIREKRSLCPALLETPALLCSLLCDLYDASRAQEARGDEVLTRVERRSDYEQMKKEGRTVSFTSTSHMEFLPAYTNKAGLVLMRFHLTPGVPMADPGTLLEDYAKPEEAEVLLPPGLALRFSEQEVGGELRKIRDLYGDPPAVLADVTVTEAKPVVRTLPPLSRAQLAEGAADGASVLRALMRGTAPEAEEVLRYCRWKKALTEALLSGASI